MASSSSSTVGPASSKGKQPQRGAAPSSSSASSSNPPRKSRIENLRAALSGFSELLDAAATPKNFASAIPQLDAQTAEAIRLQFLQALKDSIAENNEQLIQEHDLPRLLDQLDTLVAEAEARASRGATPKGKGKSRVSSAADDTNEGEEEKDVWRADLDIQTALQARENLDREEDLRALEQQLEDLRQENRNRRQELQQVTFRAREQQKYASETLQALIESTQALHPTPQQEKAMTELKEALLADLGARS